MNTEDKVEQLKEMLKNNNSTPQVEPEKGEEPSPCSQCQELQSAISAQKDQHLRMLAEFENYKKRLAREQDEIFKFANQKIINEMLPILDSFEMTLTHFGQEKNSVTEGVELILKQLLSALEKYGVQEITGLNQPFDPNFHEAIGTEPCPENLPSNTVLKVLRKGYQMHGKVLRATMVMVSA